MNLKKYKWLAFIFCLSLTFGSFNGMAYAETLDDTVAAPLLEEVEYRVEYHSDPGGEALAEDKIVTGQAAGTLVTEEARSIAGYTEDEATKSIVLASEVENVLTFTYTPNTDISYTVEYLSAADGTMVADAKSVGSQTMGITVTEEAIAIEGMTAIDQIKELKLEADGNVIQFYYNPVSNDAQEPAEETPVTTEPAIEENLSMNMMQAEGITLQSLLDGTFQSTTDLLPATGQSPNQKTQARYVWYDGSMLYVAIVYSSDKPLEELVFDNGMGDYEVFGPTSIAAMSWTGTTYNTPFYLNGDPYYLESGLNKDSRWMVIQLGDREIGGSFSLGLTTMAGGFSTTLVVEIDSQLEVYHQYGPEATFLDEDQSGYLTGPSGGYYSFNVHPVQRTGFYLYSIEITINDGTTITTSPAAALVDGYLTGQVPETTGTPKAVITFIYIGLSGELSVTPYSGVYDGEAHSITVSGITADDTVYYSLTNNGTDWTTTLPTFTDVTSGAIVYVKVTRTGYDDRTGQATVTITAKPVTVTATSGSLVYNGSEQTISGYQTPVGLLSGHVLSGISASGSGTNVGTYPVNFTGSAVIMDGMVDVTENYVITLVPGTLTITKATGAALEIIDYTGVYDGTAHCITLAGILEGDLVSYSLDETNWTETMPMFTDVTSGSAVYVKVTNVNYNDRTGEGTVTITARPITITAASASKTYNGTALTNNSWSMTSGTMATGEAIYSVTVTGSQLAVGSSANVATNAAIYRGEEVDVTQNYAITYVDGLLTVTKKKGGGGTVIIPEEEVPAGLIPDHIAYIQGYPENVVRPEGNVTREEVAAVFFRLLEPTYKETIRTATSDFRDVGTGRWSTKHVGTLVTGKIIEGYPDGSFKPGNPITRAELAAIASRFDNLIPTTSSLFSDTSGHWAEKYINSAQMKGWVNGYPDGTYKPDQYITRAEFVTLVNNVLQRRVHTENILPEAKQFPDLVKGKWYYEAMQEAINTHIYERLEDTYENWTEIYTPIIEM